MCIYIYIYIYTHIHIYIYIYTYIHITVSSHNLNSRDFNLRVSNHGKPSPFSGNVCMQDFKAPGSRRTFKTLCHKLAVWSRLAAGQLAEVRPSERQGPVGGEGKLALASIIL